MLSDFLIGRKCIVFEVPPKYEPLYDKLIDVVGTIVEIHGGKNIGIEIPGSLMRSLSAVYSGLIKKQ